jgi:hypothetical protein
MTMLGLVFAVTLIVVGSGFSLLVRRQQRSVQRVSRGLQRIARGQYDARVESGRNDAFAPLFERFNDMANRLEERHGYLKHKPARRPLPEAPDDDSGIDETIEMQRPADEEDDDSNVLPLADRKRKGSNRSGGD